MRGGGCNVVRPHKRSLRNQNWRAQCERRRNKGESLRISGLRRSRVRSRFRTSTGSGIRSPSKLTASTKHVLALRAWKRPSSSTWNPALPVRSKCSSWSRRSPHHVNVGQIQRWLALGSTNPNEGKQEEIG
jgi:hypothetical protein